MEMTNAQRVEELNRLRVRVLDEIAHCDHVIGAPLIERCPCIVATEDGKYQVGCTDDNMATVTIGDLVCPVQFTPKAANRLAKEFKAENGYGPLVWHVFSAKAFYAKRRQNLQPIVGMYDELIVKFSN